MKFRDYLEQLFFLVEPLVTAFLYPFYFLWERWRSDVRVPIFMYHQTGSRLRGCKFCDDCVSREKFAAQIEALLNAGYRVIPLGRVMDALEHASDEDLRKCVVLTFDDGLRGQFLNAFPLLMQRALPATFFVITGYVGTDRFLPHLRLDDERLRGVDRVASEWLPLSWSELEEMARHGMEIGSHTVSHRSLGCLSADEVEREVRRSKEILTERLRAPTDLFAYPFGTASCGDFNPGIQKVLRATGYRAACTTVVGRNSLATNSLALRRIPIEEKDGPFRLRCKLIGAYDWVARVKDSWQRIVPRETIVDAPLAVLPSNDET